MSGKTLDFDKVKLIKRKFHASKQPINLNSVNASKIVMSARVKYVFYWLDRQWSYTPLCIIIRHESDPRIAISDIFVFFLH